MPGEPYCSTFTTAPFNAPATRASGTGQPLPRPATAPCAFCWRSAGGLADVSVIAGQLAVPGFAAFAYREPGDGQGGDRVGPPPAEGREQDQSEQGSGGQGGAQDGLGGVGQDERVAKRRADAPLAPAQER